MATPDAAGDGLPAADAADVAPQRSGSIPPDLARRLESLGLLQTGSRAASTASVTNATLQSQDARTEHPPAAVLWTVPKPARACSGALSRSNAVVEQGAFDAAAEAAVASAARSTPAKLPSDACSGSTRRQPSERSPPPLVSTQSGKAMWECAVCMEGGAGGLASLPCGHIFHGACLLRALAAQRVCPVCRAAVESVEDIRRVFL